MNLIDIFESTPDKLDHLREKYVEFNHLYFDGTLPLVPIKWSAMKNAGAAVTGKTTRKANEPRSAAVLIPNSVEMKFSTKYQRTPEQLEPLLLHEMVHVYVMMVLGNVMDNHGPTFLRVLQDVKNKSGIDVPITDDAKGLELAVKETPVGVILRQDIRTGQFAYALMSPNVIRSKLPEIVERWNVRAIAVKVIIVATPTWTEKASRTPLQRTVGYKMRFYIPSEDDVYDLLNNGKILWDSE